MEFCPYVLLGDHELTDIIKTVLVLSSARVQQPHTIRKLQAMFIDVPLSHSRLRQFFSFLGSILRFLVIEIA